MLDLDETLRTALATVLFVLIVVGSYIVGNVALGLLQGGV